MIVRKTEGTDNHALSALAYRSKAYWGIPRSFWTTVGKI